MPLPTEKQKPQVGIGKIWLYGDAKIGKTTTAAEIDPDHTLVLDTEGSAVALEAFVKPIRSWEEFRATNAELAQGGHPFTQVNVDTVDVLAQLCADFTLRGLAGLQPGQEKFLHASDFEYGKGWDAVRKEFELRIAQLCQLVPNVVFISHANETTIKTRSGGERQVMKPMLAPKGVYAFLEGFVDRIVYAELVPEEGGQETRLLRTAPSSNYLAGGRTPRGVDPPADPLPMDGRRFRAALEAATAPLPAAELSGKGRKPVKQPPAGEGVEQQQLAETI